MEYIIILSILIVLIILLCSWFNRKLKSYRNKRIGYQGEKTVNKILRKLSSRKYRILNNILLPTKTGFSEIDHIVISRYGIFVIETKNYSGSIYGDGHAQIWKHYIGRNEHTFRNPIRQNYGHIKAIKYLLKSFDNLEYVSIIAFPPTTKLNNICNLNNTYVIPWDKLRKRIRRYWQRNISKTEIDKIADILLKANVNNHKNKQIHIATIKGNS